MWFIGLMVDLCDASYNRQVPACGEEVKALACGKKQNMRHARKGVGKLNEGFDLNIH